MFHELCIFNMKNYTVENVTSRATKRSSIQIWQTLQEVCKLIKFAAAFDTTHSDPQEINLLNFSDHSKPNLKISLKVVKDVPLCCFCDAKTIKSTVLLLVRLLFSCIQQIDTVSIKCKFKENKSEKDDSSNGLTR